MLFFSPLNLSFWLILYIPYYKRHTFLFSEPFHSEDGITLNRLFRIASQQGLLPNFFFPPTTRLRISFKKGATIFVINWETWRYVYRIGMIRDNILATWGIRKKVECREGGESLCLYQQNFHWCGEHFSAPRKKQESSLNFLTGKARTFTHIAQG